jgi:CheY-like chemotaxis protein
LLSQIRERYPGVPCIATSVGDESASARQNKVDAFLLKPVEKDVLLGELRDRTAQTGVRRLLVVDDNEIARYILRDLLDQPWLQIREASSGKEALSSISAELPDAIILDLLMPDMSGFEVLRQLRAHRATEKLPILIYTSKDVSESEQLELDALNTRMIKKAEVTSRLSARPFLDWARSVGLSPESAASERNA